MNRQELLTKRAMEWAEWPFLGGGGYSHAPGLPVVYEADYLAERTRLINKPSWDDAPDGVQWMAQDKDGSWSWFFEKPAPPWPRPRRMYERI